MTVTIVTTTYTYDLANRLSTAKSDDSPTTWHYVYDNNGSRLQQLPGGLTPAAGAVQYSYDQSRRLVQVESHDGTAFQLQAEMVYDGRGNRLQAIAYANGSTITASYTLDPRSGLPLIVDNGTSRTIILYGQAAIGEYSSEWRYYLGDAQLSVRQLVDESGSVTQAQTYAPFGILLHQAGDGGGLFGYKGGQSSTNGLWYFGNGYFDPNTGQFISANGDAASPLAAANAVGFFLAPILFIGWRRKGKKSIHPATLLFLGILLAVTLASCVKSGGDGQATGTPEAPVIPPTGADDATPTNTQLPPVVIEVTPEPPQSTAEPTPTIPPTATDCPLEEPTSTQPPSPTPTPMPNANLFQITFDDIVNAGGMANYLSTESEALVLARIAMGEGEEGNYDDQDFIMWTVRARAAVGFANGGATVRGRRAAPTTINQEALNGNAYHAIQSILSWTVPETQPCSWNLTRMTYPCEGRYLTDFNRAYQKAQTILASSLHAMPEQVRGYESFKAAPVTGPGTPPPPPAVYCSEGGNTNFDPEVNRMHAQLAGSTIFRDCYLNDNDLLTELGIYVPKP